MPNLLDLRIPNATISASNIANGAVTASKINASSVTDTHLASTLDLSSNSITLPTGVVDADTVASGTVLQCVSLQFTNSTSFAVNGSSYTSQTWYDMPGGSLSITARASNSLYIMVASTQGYHDTWNTGINMTFNFNGTDLMSSAATWNQEGNGHSYANSYHLKQVDSVASTISAGTTFTVKLRKGWYRTGGTDWTNYPGYGIQSGMSVWEVKA